MLWRLLAGWVALLPWRALTWPGGVLGWLVGSVLRVRRRHARESMVRAGVASPERELRRMYRSLGSLVFELLWTAGRPEADVNQLFEQDASEWGAVREAIRLGRGLVVATAHTGNWDLLACAMASRVKLMVITRHMSWRSADRFWQKMRADRGVVLVDAAGAVGRATAHLREGGVVAFLIDQRPLHDRGTTSCDFLGAPARQDKAFADIAMRARAPVAVAFAERLASGGHRLRVPAVIQPPERASGRWVEQTVRRAASELEKYVRESPGQWLWLHRRWGEDGRPPQGSAG